MDANLKKLFGLVQKDLGKEVVFQGDDLAMSSTVKYGVPSGIPQMDLYLGGRGGYPAGKIIEFYGKQMCGKTTAALQAAAEWQKRGGAVCFIDTEHSFDPQRARQVGLNPEGVIKIDVDTIELAFKAIIKTLDELEETGFDKPFLFIVDSVNGVPTQADVDGDLDSNERPGYEAKQIKRGCKKINSRLNVLPCHPSVIFINHGVVRFVQFGKSMDSGGGMGIKFYASVRVEFGHMGWEKDAKSGARLGQKIKTKIEKLKGGQVSFPDFNLILWNKDGFDRRGSLRDAMVASGMATKGRGMVTVLPGTGLETAVKLGEWEDWIEEQGGYDTVYLNFREHITKQGVLNPWGGAS